MCDHNKNIYLPYLATIEEVIDETPDVRTLKLVFQDEQVRENFTFRAGQFGEYSAFGAGESTFCIASSPTRKGFIECCFRSVGRVTEALRRLEVGDTMGVRGPYGNSFPDRGVLRQEPGLRGRRHRPAAAADPDLELPGLARQVRRHHHRLRSPHRSGPGLQAGTEGVAGTRGRAPGQDRRSGRQRPRLGRQGRFRADDPGRGGALGRRTPSPWSAARRS